MSCIDQSFAQFQQTAQFFNPDIGNNGTLRMPQKIKKREISMPSYYFDDFKGLLKQPIKITSNITQRRNTHTTTTTQDSSQLSQSIKQPNKSLKQLTQANNQDYSKIINIISQFNHSNKLKHAQSANSMKYKLIIPLKEKSMNVNMTRDSRTNSRCSVVSAQGERKRSIKVNDPYGLINNKIMSKTNSKQFLKQKAQDKLVDKLFSQRSDSVQ
ncbi:unnamed protein product [Paramecium octaurelia]|uniref:Uncharacterized protein n=1 Tax=Paramecium octaurelia TaxID=43137 RepID=A0A8S1WKE9_PAROT|nr:unnamed protein product [Paramecium octaurelia]